MNVRSFVSSFAVAMLLFIVSVTMIGAVLISYEEKQFNTYANNLAKNKAEGYSARLVDRSSIGAV